MQTAPNDDNLEANTEYVRRLYKDVLDWYRSAEGKAQIVVTLNGVFVTFVITSLFQQKDLPINRLPWYTLGFLGLMTASLAISLYHAISCLWSRLERPSELAAFLDQATVDRSDYHTYKPSVCWFFQRIPELDKAQFEKRMRNLEPGFEVDALASQIYLLSKNVRAKHSHVNFGFAFSALTFLLFMVSGLSYLVSLTGVP